MNVDVIVAGGGPVGLAAAIDARMRGLSVVVVEPRAGAIDKACGEGLMPGALPILARLGVDPVGMPLRGISYRKGSLRADHPFSAGPGRGVRRTELHDALTERAASLGVERVTGNVESFEQDAAGITVGDIRGSWLLGCDGLHSSVRRALGVELPVPARGRRYGYRQHFRLEPESEFVEVHWARRVEAYVTPVTEDVIGVSLLGPRGVEFRSALAGIPALARVLAAEPASALRAAGPFHQRTSAQSRGRVMLVGDASGYVDAITGEGLRLGFAQAAASIDCVVAGTSADYDATWAAITRDFRSLTGSLVRAATSPIRGAIVPAAVALPRVYGSIVDKLAR
jgi:flavin-dependent dehydrogenase